MKKTCKIEGCENKSRSLRFCSKHHRRFKAHGDPTFTKIEMHNLSHIPEHKIWRNMKDRCYNSNHSGYKDYGGRGIQVCPEWRNSFTAFYKDMGPRKFDNQSLDRKNNDGNYEPGNCRWTTPKVQSQNTRDTVLNPELVIKIRKLFNEGYKKIEISKKLDLKYHLVDNALKKNPDGSWKQWKPVRKIKEKN